MSWSEPVFEGKLCSVHRALNGTRYVVDRICVACATTPHVAEQRARAAKLRAIRCACCKGADSAGEWVADTERGSTICSRCWRIVSAIAGSLGAVRVVLAYLDGSDLL